MLPDGSGALLSADTRRRLVLGVLGSVVLAGAEIAGLLGVAVLLRLLTDASITTGAVGALHRFVGRPDREGFTLLVAFLVLVFFVGKGLGAIAFRRWMLRFIAEQESETATTLLASYLRGPYWLHLRRNTGDLMRTMYDATTATYSLVISAVVAMIPDLLTVFAIFVVLLLVTPLLALGVLVVLTVAGVLLQTLVRSRADRAGVALTESGARAYSATLQSLGGIKEIQVRRNAGYFLDRFTEARQVQARARASVLFLGELPRYALELVFIFAVVLVTVLSLATSDTRQQSLSAIGLFVAAGFRLLPSLVRVVGAANSLRVGQPSMRLVLDDLATALELPSLEDDEGVERVRLGRDLEVHEVRFRYPGTTEDVLSSVSLRIPAGGSFALVGASGVGKSTLLDLILGLHAMQEGDLRIDGESVLDRLPDWQRSIGLVPQDVFLLDDTIAANVAFGVPDEEVDRDQVWKSLRRAQLEDFVASLPEGLRTSVGERGARVSGGQRQRIGIARALYIRPELLVLDEATSALDNETEARIEQTIVSLAGDLTILVVAHRLSTVRNCDQVAFMEGGRITAVGTFEELRESSTSFARLVSLGELS